MIDPRQRLAIRLFMAAVMIAAILFAIALFFALSFGWQYHAPWRNWLNLTIHGVFPAAIVILIARQGLRRIGQGDMPGVMIRGGLAAVILAAAVAVSHAGLYVL